MYAIIQIGKEQVRVSVGDKINVEKINKETNTEVIFDKVLMLSNNGDIIFGKPYIEMASIKAEIVGYGKADKVLVYRPMSKKAIKKLNGHRQQFTVLEIKNIIGG